MLNGLWSHMTFTHLKVPLCIAGMMQSEQEWVSSQMLLNPTRAPYSPAMSTAT